MIITKLIFCIITSVFSLTWSCRNHSRHGSTPKTQWHRECYWSHHRSELKPSLRIKQIKNTRQIKVTWCGKTTHIIWHITCNIQRQQRSMFIKILHNIDCTIYDWICTINYLYLQVDGAVLNFCHNLTFFF